MDLLQHTGQLDESVVVIQVVERDRIRLDKTMDLEDALKQLEPSLDNTEECRLIQAEEALAAMILLKVRFAAYLVSV